VDKHLCSSQGHLLSGGRYVSSSRICVLTCSGCIFTSSVGLQSLLIAKAVTGVVHQNPDHFTEDLKEFFIWGVILEIQNSLDDFTTSFFICICSLSTTANNRTEPASRGTSAGSTQSPHATASDRFISCPLPSIVLALFYQTRSETTLWRFSLWVLSACGVERFQLYYLSCSLSSLKPAPSCTCGSCCSIFFFWDVSIPEVTA